MTDAQGRYEIRIVRPGQYYLGVSLNHTPAATRRIPDGFIRGPVIPALATTIDFSGKPRLAPMPSCCRTNSPAEQLMGLSSGAMDNRCPERS